MSTQLSFGRDAQGYNAYAPMFPTDIFTATIATGTARSFTVPSNFPLFIMYVQVQPNGWCWVSRTGTAAVPAGAPLAASASEMAAGTQLYKRVVNAGDVISFITANTTCDVSVSLFNLPRP